ncbi:MAG: Maf family nucleotide pyrophosphatase [Paralcaligenes sp.]
MRLILASSSRYRQTMLARLRIPYTAIAPNVDETPRPHESPANLALRLSIAKANAVARHHSNALVIGSDQVATIKGEPIGKAGNFETAQIQLRQLSGQTVEFHSALCVTDGRRSETADVLTHCQFRVLTEAEIDSYLRIEQPYDTAGSAKAESLGIALMESMRSDDPTAIVGLPLIALCRMLRSFGLNPITFSEAP